MSSKLLPKAVGEFADENYWKKFFSDFEKERDDAFEWYGAYADLRTCLDKYLKVSDRILQIGCGNSTLADGLYDKGYRHVTSIDIVSDVIKKQKQRNRKKRAKLVFEVADATSQLPYESDSFNVVLDKGTLDALMSAESAETVEKIRKMFENVERCLSNGGRYLVISLGQLSVLKGWISYFSGKCLLRIHQVMSRSNSAEKHAVFMLIATKLSNAIKIPHLYEFVSSACTSPNRITEPEDLYACVKAAQQYAYFCYRASQPFLEEDLHIQLYENGSHVAAYNVALVHKRENPKSGRPFGVFIVPRGNENGYFYSTVEGRQELCKIANFRRLVVVSQCRRSKNAKLENKSMDDIKADLNNTVLDFAPSYVKNPADADIPYLSLGPDKDTLSRTILQTFGSEISGNFEVVEVELAESDSKDRVAQKFRQLIFEDSRSAIQSEIKISPDGTTLDWSNLACLHHRAIVSALAISAENFLREPLNICIIGLGGGCLATFLRKHFPNVKITVVELDPVVLEAAKLWFEFKTDEQCTCIIDDGVNYLNRLVADQSANLFDVVIFDVASSEALEGGLTCPPPVFLSAHIATAVKSLLRSKGALALNLMMRSKQASSDVKRLFGDTFETVLSHGISEDTVNELLICLPYKPADLSEFNQSVQRRLTALHEYLAMLCRGPTEKIDNLQLEPSAKSAETKSTLTTSLVQEPVQEIIAQIMHI